MKKTNKILSILYKALTILLIIIAIIVIYFYIDVKFINPGYKGISEKDLSQICIFFVSVYLLKSIIKGLTKLNTRKE